MSFAAKTMLKPATNGCITSVPSLFAASKASYSHPCLSIPFKPLNFQVSCYASSHFLKKKEPVLRVSVIAAQQEFEGNLSFDSSETGVEAGESDGYVEPPEEAKLYVGNLPFNVDNETLAGLFGEAGVVEIVEIIQNRETGQSRGFGFVTMCTVEEAEKAIELFNRYDLQGRFLTVNKASQRGERPPRVFEPRYRIYVGNLPWSADDARLMEVFSEYGKVLSARVVSDRDSGRSRGFGFVEMSSESEMNDAIGNLDGQNLDGRAINVNVAAERPPRRNSF